MPLHGGHIHTGQSKKISLINDFIGHLEINYKRFYL